MEGSALFDDSGVCWTYRLIFMKIQFLSYLEILCSYVFPICAYGYKPMKISLEKYTILVRFLLL